MHPCCGCCVRTLSEVQGRLGVAAAGLNGRHASGQTTDCDDRQPSEQQDICYESGE